MNKPSKSAMKREVEGMQNWALAISKLPPKQIEKLGLPDKLYAAVIEYKNLKSNGALRRQAQYLGVLMRAMDSEDVEKMKKLTQHLIL